MSSEQEAYPGVPIDIEMVALYRWQYSTCGTCEICEVNPMACSNQINSGRERLSRNRIRYALWVSN